MATRRQGRGAKKRARKTKSSAKRARSTKARKKTAARKTKVAKRPQKRSAKKAALPARKSAAKKTAAPKKAAAAKTSTSGVLVKGKLAPRFGEILTRDALAFIAELHRHFDHKRRDLLARRRDMQQRFDSGVLPDFLADTQAVRDANWKIAPLPQDLHDRRVEITGPVDRKMVINALNSGANVFMADFEDACSPYWSNLIEGQLNLKDRWSGKLSFVDPETKKSYALGSKPAVLIVRPRGWHLPEDHVLVDGKPVSGALFDFGLYLFHNAEKAIAAGSGPYFYLPKLETHREARLWNDVFIFSQQQLGLPLRSIKATVLIETLPAAFEMDEILFELRDHIAGLNAGRWDYIFSFIKRLGKNQRFLTPDRGAMTMDKAFLVAYAKLLVKTCHRRGAFAMGGMAAQIPVRDDEDANTAAFAKVRADKEREANQGHDGTWVAHPGLVPVAREVFDRLMPNENQVDKLRNDVNVTREELLTVHTGERSEAGLRENIRVGVQYIEAWLQRRGAVPLYNLMEDAATAEISRAQIWQWMYHGATLSDGREVTAELFREICEDEMAKVREAIGPKIYDAGRFKDAVRLFTEMSLAEEFAEFLTLPAYRLVAHA